MGTRQSLAPLRRPDWATDRLVDETLIEYWRLIGSVPSDDCDRAFEVTVIQQHELDFVADPPAVECHPVQIRLGEVRISADQAREIAALLVSGAELVDAVTVQQR